MIRPMIFNTEMVRAIIDGRKTVTRRLRKNSTKKPIEVGDIIYVRETSYWVPCYGCNLSAKKDCCTVPKPIYNEKKMEYGCYIYKSDFEDNTYSKYYKWRPSIHMPREAARIWLKVTGVNKKRLKNMTLNDLLNEGVVLNPEVFNDPDNAYIQAVNQFRLIWNSTLKKEDIDTYGWDANPYVWVIEFEGCAKPEGWNK